MEKPKKLLNSIKSLSLRRSNPRQFDQFVDLLNLSEEKRRAYMQDKLARNYKIWSDHFYKLKREFANLWDFFNSIEEKTEDWFCISPTGSPWGSVGHNNREGYTFSACIMKNHRRNAPLAEKSLRVSYSLEEWGSGIGDERGLGRVTEIDDNLAGLEQFQGVSLEQQYLESKRLVARVNQHQLLFRLNHRNIGQETARLDLSILREFTLPELAEKLFILVNKDSIHSLDNKIEEIKTKAIEQNS